MIMNCSIFNFMVDATEKQECVPCGPLKTEIETNAVENKRSERERKKEQNGSRRAAGRSAMVEGSERVHLEWCIEMLSGEIER